MVTVARKRTIYQRKSYACRRMSLAVDRLIRANNPDEKVKAKRWVEVWAVVGGIRRYV